MAHWPSIMLAATLPEWCKTPQQVSATLPVKGMGDDVSERAGGQFADTALHAEGEGAIEGSHLQNLPG